MKKRILSLVLCAAMLLSMCLFLGAGVVDDTAADGSAESTESYVPAVNFTNVAPFVQANAQVQAAQSSLLRSASVNAISLAAASANSSTVPTDPSRTTSDAVVTEKTATDLGNGQYQIKLTSYTTGTVTEQQTTKPTDIVLVLDQSGSMATKDMAVSNYTAYTDTKNSSLYNNSNNLWYKQGDSYVQVTVTRTEGYDYQPYNGQKNSTYYDARDNLYAKVNGQYQKVEVNRENYNLLSPYKYTYKVSGKTIATSQASECSQDIVPSFTDIEGIYLRNSYYKYAYSYTYNGLTVSLGTSTGADTQFKDATLYKKEDSKITRLDALKTAATNFVNQIAQKADADGVDHRIAIVGFSSDGYYNTEILTGCTIRQGSSVASGTYDFPNGYNMNGVQKGNATSTDYQNALVDMRTESGKTSATNAIKALTAYGGTETNQGMDMAEKIFANDSKKEQDRNRVVVLFTDGVPGHNSQDGTEKINASYANPAIKFANDISKNYSATIYTVGIFSGANGKNPGELPNNGSWYNGQTANSTTANRFMHLVSSNYPDATAMNNPGSVNSSLKNDDSYYLSASDADTLNSIFEKISNNISAPSIELGKQAYVQDTVSDYFTAPVDGKVTVATQKAGYDANGKLVWTDETAPADLNAEVNGKTVKVSGFDYDVNFVSASDKGRDENDQSKTGNFYGRRLVVTFTVKAEPGFLGGNNVPTNTSDSGVYTKENTLVENFDYPRVNVPINTPTLNSKDANVYYGGDVPNAEKLCTTGTIGEKMADYVDITYSVDGTVSNTTDDTYQVTMTVSPKYNGTGADGAPATEKTASVMSKVNVYTPEITFNDSRINYGATADYNNNGGAVVWKHKNDAAADMTGTAPALTYAYDPAAGVFTQDTYVNVTVTSDKDTETTKISDAVTFVHTEDNDFPGCSFDSSKGQFIVHINVFDLTIRKTAKDGTTIDSDQTFVFKVKNNDNGETMEIVITGSGEQVIKNLPMGSYTITEDTSWSWKYTPTDASKTIAVSETSATVTFENKNQGTNWLTSIAKAINTWAGGTAQKK